MDPNKYLGCSILDVLGELRTAFPLVEYSKVEDDEFLKIPESGVYFHSKLGGIIGAFRVYYSRCGDYYSASADVKKTCLPAVTVNDAFMLLGEPARSIPSVRIPGAAPTKPGYEFLKEGKVLTVYFEPDESIAYVHVKLGKK